MIAPTTFFKGPVAELKISYFKRIVKERFTDQNGASSLVDELAAEYRGPGSLLTFSTERELIGLLNELEGGASPEGRALGEGRKGPAWTWDSAAGEILRMTKALVQNAPSRQMLRRTGLSRGLSHRTCD